MDTLHLVFTTVTVIFIAATMFAAGLGTILSALRGIFTNLPLLVLALVANMVVIPLLSWGHRRTLQPGRHVRSAA